MNVHANALARDYLDNYAVPSHSFPPPKPALQSAVKLSHDDAFLPNNYNNKQLAGGTQICKANGQECLVSTQLSIHQLEYYGKRHLKLLSAKIFIVKFAHADPHLPTSTCGHMH